MKAEKQKYVFIISSIAIANPYILLIYCPAYSAYCLLPVAWYQEDNTRFRSGRQEVTLAWVVACIDTFQKALTPSPRNKEVLEPEHNWNTYIHILYIYYVFPYIRIMGCQLQVTGKK